METRSGTSLALPASDIPSTRSHRSGSVSGRLRAASDLEENGIIDFAQKGVLKDLIVSGHPELKVAIDKYRAGDCSLLLELVRAGALNGGVPGDILDGLDFDFLNVLHAANRRHNSISDEFSFDHNFTEDATAFSMDAWRSQPLSSAGTSRKRLNSKVSWIDQSSRDPDDSSNQALQATSMEQDCEEPKSRSNSIQSFNQFLFKSDDSAPFTFSPGTFPLNSPEVLDCNAPDLGTVSFALPQSAVSALEASSSSSCSSSLSSRIRSQRAKLKIERIANTRSRKKRSSNGSFIKKPSSKKNEDDDDNDADREDDDDDDDDDDNEEEVGYSKRQVRKKPAKAPTSSVANYSQIAMSIMESEGIASMLLSSQQGNVGTYSPEARKQRIERYLDKKKNRVWVRRVKYDVRKNFADSRMRCKGRFVKKVDEFGMKGEG